MISTFSHLRISSSMGLERSFFINNPTEICAVMTKIMTNNHKGNHGKISLLSFMSIKITHIDSIDEPRKTFMSICIFSSSA